MLGDVECAKTMRVSATEMVCVSPNLRDVDGKSSFGRPLVARVSIGGMLSEPRRWRPPTFKFKVVDCEVSDWSEWSRCAGDCKRQRNLLPRARKSVLGVMERTRHVVTGAGPGGAACPPLKENRQCDPC